MRRRVEVVLKHVMLTTGAFLSLVACTAAGPAPETPPQEEGKPKYGGTLTMAEGAALTSTAMDAHQGIPSNNLNTAGNVHLPLIGEDTQARGGKITGYLATSWEASKDGKAYTFKVRELTTHKGKPFNAEDVAANFQRFLDRPNKLPLARSGCVRELVERAEARDRGTVVIHLQDVSAGFLSCLANPHIMFQPKHMLEQIDGPGKGNQPPAEEVDGVGPFRMVKFIDGSIWEAQRFEQYYREGLPYVERLVSVALPDAASVIAAFRTQRIDIFSKNATTPQHEEAEALKREFGDRVIFKEVVSPGPDGFQLHYRRRPLDDIRVRKAIDLAYNRQAYRDLLLGGEGTFSGPYYCYWKWYLSCGELQSWSGHRDDKGEDLKRAKDLMRQAGYDPDKPGSLVLTAGCGTTSPDKCNVLQDDLSKIGIDLKIVRLEGATQRKQVEDQAFDISPWVRILTPGDPDDYNSLHYTPKAVENRARWEHSRFNELFLLQRRELDQDKRAKLVREMGQIIYNDHVLLHGYREMLHQGWWGYVKGYVPPSEEWPHQTTYIADQVWLDK
ncbi:MAG: ABC transporter substrate-binding protein [Chloroflexi bacterium]|nr:ABC transporter substrate-binding protein [Chloroflexota bacterium]